MNNMIIGVGNAGSCIVRQAAISPLLGDVSMYAIDSVAMNVTLDNINKVEVIPIISDEKNGSGRNRERGKAMFEYHESQGDFKKMYENAANSKSPILVITSAAGGTGSGASIPLCKSLMELGVQVIPIIICPNMNDPAAYHLNANDLFVDMNEIGIETYSVFRNSRGDADYTPINKEVVSLIEIIFGKKYGKTNLDSIDDSDLDVILSTPGRFIAIEASAGDIPNLRKEMTRKVFSGYQPAWSEDDARTHTIISAYSLKSMFANTDFKNVFEEINNRLPNVYDEYRNIVMNDNSGNAEASIIIAGLPRPEVREDVNETNFMNAKSIGDGMSRSHRPDFMRRKKASVSVDKAGDSPDSGVINKFKWSK